MYSPQHEQTPIMCGHVSIYGYFPTEIPGKETTCWTWPWPPFSCYFPTLKIQFEQPSTQQNLLFHSPFYQKCMFQKFSKEVNKITHNAWWENLLFSTFILQSHVRFGMIIQKPIMQQFMDDWYCNFGQSYAMAHPSINKWSKCCSKLTREAECTGFVYVLMCC